MQTSWRHYAQKYEYRARADTGRAHKCNSDLFPGCCDRLETHPTAVEMFDHRDEPTDPRTDVYHPPSVLLEAPFKPGLFLPVSYHG